MRIKFPSFFTLPLKSELPSYSSPTTVNHTRHLASVALERGLKNGLARRRKVGRSGGTWAGVGADAPRFEEAQHLLGQLLEGLLGEAGRGGGPGKVEVPDELN